jgi:hypothetical protein
LVAVVGRGATGALGLFVAVAVGGRCGTAGGTTGLAEFVCTAGFAVATDFAGFGCRVGRTVAAGGFASGITTLDGFTSADGAVAVFAGEDGVTEVAVVAGGAGAGSGGAA